MKVLLVCEDIPATKLGGLAKHVVALGNALLTAGHDVALMGQDSPAYADCAEEVGFNGRFIAGFGNPLRGWKEQQLGFFNPWKRPYFARRLARAIQAYAANFDVVHYHGHQPMVGRYIPATTNFVQTRHDQGGDCIINLRFKNGDLCRERSAAACATCIREKPGYLRSAVSMKAVQWYRARTEEAFAAHPVIFVSEFLRKNLKETMPAARLARSVVLHNFVDEDLVSSIRASATNDFPSTATKIHIAGRLDDAKGIRQFLELLAPRLPPNWQVDVYGDGPLRARMEKALACDVLRFHGHSPQRQTLLAAARANASVVPSLWEEAFGLVTLEALRLGTMCFALRRGGTPELAIYGAPGQLKLFDSLPALVDALLATTDFSVEAGGASADVRQHMAALLAIYEGGKNGR